MSITSITGAPTMAMGLDALQGAGAQFLGALFAPNSTVSLTSLAAALCLAGVLTLARRGRAKSTPIKVLLRALFPRGLVRNRTHRTDIGFFLFNTVLYGAIFGWAILTQAAIGGAVLGGIQGVFGPGPDLPIGPVGVLLLCTVFLFLAAELGHWIDHWASHRIPFLWELHKVHHSAEALSPLTNLRMHPLDGLKFANIVALVMGLTDAGLTWLLGERARVFTVFDSNVIALAGLYTVQHLQHTHLWVVYPGVLGQLITSPAHHQIHHSTNPDHFGKNLGGLLTLWDRVFGTFHAPAAKRERLVMGLGPDESRHDSVMEGLVMPVVRAFATLRPADRGRRGHAVDRFGPVRPR